MSRITPIKITVDKAAIRKIEGDLMHIKDGAPLAVSRAINHTLNVTRTEASKEIRKQVKLKASYVKGKLRLQKATQSNLTGAIQTPTRGTLLSRYPSSQKYRQKNGLRFKSGVNVQVKPTGGKKHMPGAFFIRFANGVSGIAIRTKYGPGLGRSEGLKVLYGPSTSQVFTDVKDDLQAPSGNRLMQRLAHEAERLLRKQ
ncbi:hypothetical protein GLV89_14585 [Halomonas alkaliantarctica]|nr:hypothetical protein [Halomonas alkaliantarctica]